jgi:hypothetical protein
MTMRLLPIMTAVFLNIAPGASDACCGTWNQVAADEAARAYAAEGKCYPINGPCPASQTSVTAQPSKRSYRTLHASH